MGKLLNFFKSKFYLPNFRNRTELVYEISRILFSLIAGVTAFVISRIVYFEQNPLLGVSYTAEFLFSIGFFAIFYYLIPHIIRAVGDAITALLHQSITDMFSNIPTITEFTKTTSEKPPKINEYASRPVVLDTSSIIDGRIFSVVKEGFIDSTVIVPQFVIDELHLISDSASKLKRAKGRRGLDLLNEFKNFKKDNFKVYPTKSTNNVDKSLVKLAKKLNARIATTDFNLNKVAKVRNVTVLNINSLSNALKIKLLPGDTLQVNIIKTGESKGQGVGYLDDGTMVVVSNGADYINKTVDCKVTKVLQTDAGQLIFTDITTSFLQKNPAKLILKKSKKR